MKHRIPIENAQNERAPFRGYKSALRRAIEETLAREGVARRCEVSVTLVDRGEICRLNGAYRGVDRETDVLSFPLEDEDLPGDDTLYLGDVIVCPDVIFHQAQGFGTTYRQEFCLMVIHSTLHLLGWDHMEKNEKKQMFAKQEEILRALSEGEVKTEK